MTRPMGWKYESARHSLAARGVSTTRRFNAEQWRKKSNPKLSPSEMRGKYVGEFVEGSKNLGVLDDQTRIKTRDELEEFIMDHSKSPLMGSLRILKYRDMDKSANRVGDPLVVSMVEVGADGKEVRKMFTFKDAMNEIKVLNAEANTPGLGRVLKSEFKKRAEDLEKALNDAVSLSEKERASYRGHLFSRLQKEEAVFGKKKELVEGVGDVATSLRDVEALRAVPKQENARVSELIKKSVLVGKISPEKGARMLEEIEKLSLPAPKGELGKIVAPGLVNIEEEFVSGRLSVPKMAERQQEYVVQVKKAMESAAVRRPFTAEGLPQSAKSKMMIQWFDARKRPWLLRQ